MPTVNASGSQLATGAEDTLTTISVNGEFVLVIDCDAMQAGDTLVVRIKRKVRSTSSLKDYVEETFTGADGDGGTGVPLKISIPFPSPYQCRVTIEQTAGTLRTFEWSVEQL